MDVQTKKLHFQCSQGAFQVHAEKQIITVVPFILLMPLHSGDRTQSEM